MVEKLTYDYGFYVNYTASWIKSAQWLLWFTQLIVEAYKQGNSYNEILNFQISKATINQSTLINSCLGDLKV